MARAPNERPARRLDAILDAIRRHGVVEFEAAKLEGVGEGLRFILEPGTRVTRSAPKRRTPEPVAPDFEDDEPTGPLDELALVAEGREGPIPGNGVS